VRFLRWLAILALGAAFWWYWARHPYLFRGVTVGHLLLLLCIAFAWVWGIQLRDERDYYRLRSFMLEKLLRASPEQTVTWHRALGRQLKPESLRRGFGGGASGQVVEDQLVTARLEREADQLFRLWEQVP
jgi:hypothetical protein